MTPNQSHGHVTPNADGSKARCGGPVICATCQFELAQKYARYKPNLADRLESFIPRGDGYSSDYANTLVEAVEVLRAKAAPAEPSKPDDHACHAHPDAPHGFNRNASHTADRYVCDCEGWQPPTEPAESVEIVGYLYAVCGDLLLDHQKPNLPHEPLMTVAQHKRLMLALAIRCEQKGAFKTCMECGYQDGHDMICQYHESKRANHSADDLNMVKVPRELIEHCARILKNANSYTVAIRELAAEELRALLGGARCD